jgi:hypothetical protein
MLTRTLVRALALSSLVLGLGLPSCKSGTPAADAGVPNGGGTNHDEEFLPSDQLAKNREAYAAGATEIDLNGDGCAEYTRSFGPAGVLETECLDSNCDGSCEYFWDLKAKPMYSEEREEDGTLISRTEVELTTTDQPNGTGDVVLAIKQMVPDGAGKRIYNLDLMLNDLLAVYDVSFMVEEEIYDDKGDLVDTNTFEAHTLSSGERTCQTEQPIEVGKCPSQDELDKARDDAARRCFLCLKDISPRTATDCIRRDAQGIEVRCDDKMKDCQGKAHNILGLFSGVASRVKGELFGNRIDMGVGCGDERTLENTIFHEILHFTEPGMRWDLVSKGHGPDQSHDAVYGCQAYCFGNSKECGRCADNLGKPEACASCCVPHECSSHWGPCAQSKQKCELYHCEPSGLACYDARCLP